MLILNGEDGAIRVAVREGDVDEKEPTPLPPHSSPSKGVCIAIV